MSLVAGLLAIAYTFHDALQEPSIHSEGSDPRSPFSIPFHVTNNSGIFPMRDVEMLCVPRLIEAGNHATIVAEDKTGGIIGPGLKEIAPGETVNLFCPVGINNGDPNEIVGGAIVLMGFRSADIYLRILYRTLWFKRMSPPIEFIWYTHTHDPRWIEGRVPE